MRLEMQRVALIIIRRLLDWQIMLTLRLRCLDSVTTGKVAAFHRCNELLVNVIRLERFWFKFTFVRRSALEIFVVGQGNWCHFCKNWKIIIWHFALITAKSPSIGCLELLGIGTQENTGLKRALGAAWLKNSLCFLIDSFKIKPCYWFGYCWVFSKNEMSSSRLIGLVFS
jgi:hypothetical protein